MNTLKWMKDYPGNKFYPYTHTDAVLVGNDEENLRNLTDELNQINIQSVTEHLSNTQSHIPDGGDIGQVVGMTDGGIDGLYHNPATTLQQKLASWKMTAIIFQNQFWQMHWQKKLIKQKAWDYLPTTILPIKKKSCFI